MTHSETLQAELARHLQAKPSQPRQHLPIVQKTTPEALIERVVTTIPVVAMISDEGRNILDGYGKRVHPLTNGMRDGSPQYVETKSSGRQFVAFVRFTSNIATQSKSGNEYFARNDSAARDSGSPARQFVAWPTSTQGFRPIDGIESMAWNHIPMFNKRVKELLQQTLEKHQSPVTKLPTLKFSPKAAFLWTNYANSVEADQQPGRALCNVRDAASKAAENVARLAAVIHAFDDAEGDISLQTVETAIAMVNWYLKQFIRIFAPRVVPQVMLDALSLDLWLRGNYISKGYMSLYRKNWILQRGPLRKKSQLDAALNVLADGGQVQVWIDPKNTWCVTFIFNAQPFQLPLPN